MKNRPIGILWICGLLALICVFSPSKANARTTNPPPLIRLHVLAVSDAEEDQRKKLVVRDAVLKETDALLGECDTYAEAYSVLDERLDDVLAAAKGAADGVRVSAELTMERYPDREYANVVLPAGTYTSLKITLGEGEGQNWWCVVYPSLCGLEEAEPAQAVEIYETPPLRFGLWEWIRSLFTGDDAQ